jgi:hypothetical protein
MHPIQLLYETVSGNEADEVCHSLDEVRSRVRAICEENSARLGMPFGLDLVAASGDRLTVGFAGTQAFICAYDAGGDESVASLGDPAAVGQTVFFVADHTAIANKFLFPADAAWRAIEHWCNTGELSNEVRWTSEAGRIVRTALLPPRR